MNRDLILSAVSTFPLRMYLDFPSKTERLMTTLSSPISVGGDVFLLVLSKTIVTDALFTPAFPCLYISS
jgi:hypothetical protein